MRKTAIALHTMENEFACGNVRVVSVDMEKRWCRNVFLQFNDFFEFIEQ